MLPCFKSTRCKKKCSRPFIRSQFNPKKATPRKASSISSLHRDLVQAVLKTPPPLPSVRVKLGPEDITCEQGRWIGAKCDKSHPSFPFIKMKKSDQRLVRENSLLRLKNEILFDMLVETKAQLLLQENEIRRLKCYLHEM